MSTRKNRGSKATEKKEQSFAQFYEIAPTVLAEAKTAIGDSKTAKAQAEKFEELGRQAAEAIASGKADLVEIANTGIKIGKVVDHSDADFGTKNITFGDHVVAYGGEATEFDRIPFHGINKLSRLPMSKDIRHAYLPQIRIAAASAAIAFGEAVTVGGQDSDGLSEAEKAKAKRSREKAKASKAQPSGAKLVTRYNNGENLTDAELDEMDAYLETI